MTKLHATKIQDTILMHKFFKRINKQYRGKIFKNMINSLAKAFKLSASTIRSVIDGKKKDSKPKRKFSDRFDDFDKEAIRLVIHDFYRDNVLPTANMIKKKLKEKDINIGKSLSCKILPEISFNYKTVKENRAVFIERKEIRETRAQYLRTIRDFRRRGYRVIYLDETWVNKTHCVTKSWLPSIDTSNILNIVENRDIKLPNIPSGKGTRLIVLHTGCRETGFIPGCDLVFIGKDVDGDYHREMNAQVFMDWFRNTLLPALKEPSVIVMDNASYHNTRAGDCKSPTSASRKRCKHGFPRERYNMNLWQRNRNCMR